MTAGDIALTCGAVVVGTTFAVGFAMMIWNALALDFEARRNLKDPGKTRGENKEDEKMANGDAHKNVAVSDRKPGTDFKELLVNDARRLSLILLGCSLTLAGFGVYRFVVVQPHAGFKFVGFSIWVFAGCFDPINFLWLCLPFTFSDVVSPSRHARFAFPFICIGLVLIVIGWVGDGWLIHPS